MIEEIVSEILTVTAPLRNRLELQTLTGRLMPEYSPHDLVGAAEMYTRISASIQISEYRTSPHLKEAYLQEHDVELLHPIREEQLARYSFQSCKPVRQYWNSQKHRVTIRDKTGAIRSGPIDDQCHFLVSEIEDFVKAVMPTKLPDTHPFTGPNGERFYPYELLFLQPSIALIESRNGGIFDIQKYFSVGRLPSEDIIWQLSKKSSSLFARYGQNDEDRDLSLNTHSLRHLQTTELFRLGVADTLITKRFGRQSTEQSYTYDHRSLREYISAIELPPEASALPERLHDTAKLIHAGKMRGPIVEEFIDIQRLSGDEEAFQYLAAEADGFHVTPSVFAFLAS